VLCNDKVGCDGSVLEMPLRFVPFIGDEEAARLLLLLLLLLLEGGGDDDLGDDGEADT
jgi:hypothetical protein